MRDLHDCWLLANETRLSLVVLDQAAKALRDEEMRGLVKLQAEIIRTRVNAPGF